MSDTMVFEMASSSEASPNIFLRRDFVAIQNNNNQNYSSNQLTIDTSQLANSNRYINYREGYLQIPLLITATCDAAFAPLDPGTSFDYAVGLKNNYLTIIHSMTLDLNGTAVAQTVPFQSLYQNFRLLTTLS